MGDPGHHRNVGLWTSTGDHCKPPGASSSLPGQPLESRNHSAFSFEAPCLAGTDSRDFPKTCWTKLEEEGVEGEARSARTAECAGGGHRLGQG